jgi:hypothetical protein
MHEVLTVRTKGPVVYMNVLGTELVILNDLQSAEDLLIGRSVIYAYRPYFPMLKLCVRPTCRFDR